MDLYINIYTESDTLYVHVQSTYIFLCVCVRAYVCLRVCMCDVSTRVCVRVQTPGCAVGQVFAKLEVYLWLGPTKYSKEALNSLPEDFLPVYEEQEEQEGEGQAEQRRAMPVSLSCQGERDRTAGIPRRYCP